MESTDTIAVPGQRDARVVWIRRLFSLAAIVTAAMFAVGIVALAASKVLGLQETSRGVFYTCMYSGAIGFFVATVAHLLLDILYGIFGLLRIKIFPLLGWIFLIALSLVPLTAIFAASRLAAGLQG